MPKAKHRKRDILKRLQKKTLDSDVADSPKTIRIRRYKFARLRKEPDFLALIKVGRVLNAVMFGIQSISDYMDDYSPVGRRQYHRAIFMTGGYLYEGLALVGSIRSKYATEPFFQKFNILIGDEYSQHYKVLQEMRHSVSFHLDSGDKTTKATLERLNLPRYNLMSSETGRIMDFYFNLSDDIDFNYLIDKFKGDKNEEDTLLLIINSLTDLFITFGDAGHEFLIGLGDKMNFSEFVD